ncbi:MAG: hypothetical protein V3S24_23845 [Candidatus Tectomicrobia bacterium]
MQLTTRDIDLAYHVQQCWDQDFLGAILYNVDIVTPGVDDIGDRPEATTSAVIYV